MRKSFLIILITLAFSCVSALGFYIRPVSAIIWIEGHITSDTTWTPVDTYRVINNTYVDPDITLTISPGVHVQFADGFSLIVQGSLNATGTESSPITFTSSRSSPISGAWNTIKFQGDFTERFLLVCSRIQYAADGVSVQSLGPSAIERNVISNCSESGVVIIGHSNAVIRENVIKDNKNGISTDGSSAYSGIIIANNTISSNWEDGIHFCNNNMDPIENVSFLSNIVSSNEGNGIYVSNEGYQGSIENVSFLSNIVSSNDGNGIYVYGNGYQGSLISNLFFSSNTVSYSASNGICVSSNTDSVSDVFFDSNNISSNVLDGITITALHQVSEASFSSNTIVSNGGNGIYLDAWTNYYHMGAGIVSNVSFSSDIMSFNGGSGVCVYGKGYLGDGGVSNVFVASSVASFNGGNGFYLQGHGSASHPGYISNVSIVSSTTSSNGQDGIHLQSEGSDFYNYVYDIYVSSCVASSNENGIHTEGSPHKTELSYDMTMSDNTISANYHEGIWIVGGINSNLSRNSLCYNQYGVLYKGSLGNRANHNDIYGNDNGMNVTDEAMVNAEYDYWGDSTGPYQQSLNPEGKGNPVNGNGVDLDFIPFLTSPQGHINQRPVAALSVDKKTVSINETVTYDAINSTDDGRIDYYFFDFGDGSNSSWTTLPVITHKYVAKGTYYTTVTVMDDYGVTSTNAQLIKVQIIVVPEFPSFLILSLFMVTTLLAVIAYRKKRISTRYRIVLF